MRLGIALAWLLLLALARLGARAPAPPDPAAGAGRVAVEVPATDARGPIAGSLARLSLLHWPAASPDGRFAPVVCLHGSPGSAGNFERLGPLLAAAGREVWALDLPGFGRSRDELGGRSIQAHAHALLAALDALGLERVHLVAWSMGGGVALHAAHMARERVASLALVASIGVQEREGTGAWAAEHLQYLALRGAVEALDLGLPHFGRWSPYFDDARAFARNFQETDQRPLRGILERLELPLLLVHGAGDVLAGAGTAVESHALVQHSRLVLLDANHFVPILQADALTQELLPFLARHDARASVERRSQRLDVDLPRGLVALDPWPFELGQRVPWWLQGAAWVALAWSAPLRAAALAGLAAGSLQFAPGWILLSLGAGLLAVAVRERRIRPLLLAPVCAAAAALACQGVAAGLAALAGPAGTDFRAALACALGLAVLWSARRSRGRARDAEEGQPASTARAASCDRAPRHPPTK